MSLARQAQTPPESESERCIGPGGSCLMQRNREKGVFTSGRELYPVFMPPDPLSQASYRDFLG